MPRDLVHFAWCLSLAISTMFATAAQAETVELLNGDLVHGKVLALDADVLTLSSETFGQLKIKRESVARIVLHDRGQRGEPKSTADEPRSPLGRVQSPQEVLKQLKSDGGISEADMKAVQQKFPLLATPEVKGYVSDRLTGLLSGRLDILDIRKEAIDAVDQIKDVQKDLGPQATALNGYLSILEHFIRETEPKATDQAEQLKSGTTKPRDE